MEKSMRLEKKRKRGNYANRIGKDEMEQEEKKN
jgi:hypothetical protein